MRLEFGECTFDGECRTLLSGSGEVHLSPKAFRLLGLLLESRPRAIARTEVEGVLLPGTFVSDGSIAILVNELRRALGDGARAPRWIGTVFGFGYAFKGDARVDVDGESAVTLVYRGPSTGGSRVTRTVG